MNLVARGGVRRQLLIALLSGFALVWVIGSSLSVWQMQQQVLGLLDANLRQSAAALLHEIDEREPDDAFAVFRFSSQLVFQIWHRGTQLQLRSRLAPAQRLGASDTGFSDTVVAGREWRVFSAWSEDHNYLVMVGQQNSQRGVFLSEIVAQLVKSLLLVLPLFALMVWVVVGFVLRPLERLGDEIAKRDANNLSPVLFDVPREIAPLMRRLNELLRGLAATLDSERRFTGDAAHELRTPLAALKSQVQVAIAAQEPAQRERALAQALQACNLATYRIEQMLTLARLEQQAWRENVASIDLRALCAQVIAEVAPLAAKRGVSLALEAAAPVTVRVRAGLWAVLLRNLLDNAIRYAPAASAVTVRIDRADAAVAMVVEDQGPGIAPEKWQSALAPFDRLGRNDAEGCGLGLSIAARIAELHGARIELSPGAGERGLRACVQIPDAGPA